MKKLKIGKYQNSSFNVFARNIIGALAMFLILILISCKGDDLTVPTGRSLSFESFGLEGETVNEIRILENRLIAATKNGLFITNIDQPNWEPLTALSGKNMKAVEFISSTHWIASNWGEDNGDLFVTKDGGRSWSVLETNFGREYEKIIFDLEYDQFNGKLYASGSAVVAYSEDNGVTWEVLFGDWDILASGLDFVEKHPLKNELWAGGQNAIEGMVLSQYNFNNQKENFWLDILDPVSSAKDVLFDSNNPDFIMVGSEAGIVVSRNGGITWEVSKNDRDTYKFTFGLEIDIQNSNIIYAGGWIKLGSDYPQPLIISVSRDKGKSWTNYEYDDDQLFGGILDMTSYIENGNQSLFVGLYKGGVYKVNIVK
jgi:photosystem II stability/assembly factor-like uncharacterized protein